MQSRIYASIDVVYLKETHTQPQRGSKNINHKEGNMTDKANVRTEPIGSGPLN